MMKVLFTFSCYYLVLGKILSCTRSSSLCTLEIPLCSIECRCIPTYMAVLYFVYKFQRIAGIIITHGWWFQEGLLCIQVIIVWITFYADDFSTTIWWSFFSQIGSKTCLWHLHEIWKHIRNKVYYFSRFHTMLSTIARTKIEEQYLSN